MSNNAELLEQLRRENQALRNELADLAAQSVLNGSGNLLLDSLPIGYQIMDKAGVLLHVNQAWLDLMGHSRDSVMGAPFTDFLAPGSLRAFHDVLSAIPQHGGIQVMECMAVHKDGHMVPLLVKGSLRPAPDSGGSHCHCVVIDTSRRKKAEQDLALRTTELQMALAATNDGIWDYNLQSGEFRHNRRFAEMLGYQVNEVADFGCFCENNIHPEDMKRFQEAFGDYLEGRVPNYELEFRLRAKDGTYKWIFTRGRIVERDASGRPMRLIGAHTDITERKQYEHHLAEREERFQRMLAIIPDRISVQDTQFNIIYSNWSEFGAVAPDTRIPGAKCHEVYHGRSQPCDYCPAPQALAAHEPSQSLIRLEDNTCLDMRLLPLMDAEGRIESFMSWVRDVTDLKQSEEELRAAKERAESASLAKSTFLANMSHELRTPLNGAMGMLQLLRDTGLNEEQHEFLGYALASCDNLTRLLGDILDLSRVESGKMALVRAPFSLADLFRSIGEIYTPICAAKGIGLVLELDKTLPERLLGDEVRVRQILVNLVGNAVKFTESGEIRLQAMALECGESPLCRVLFVISDTGPGIPEDRVDEMFEAFTQAEDSLTRPHQGAGLGLQIVKRLVALMEGNAAVDSVEQVGTTIYVSLPLAHVSLDKADESPRPVWTPSVPNRRVLVAEDEPVNRLTLERFLVKLGYEPVTVCNGIEALDRIRREEFHCVLLDVQMPEMDGIETVTTLRASEQLLGHKAKLPVAALTAFAMDGDRERFLEAGMDDYLAKPVDMAELAEMLHRLMGEA